MKKIHYISMIICLALLSCNSYRNKSVFEVIDEKSGLLSQSDTTLNIVYDYIEERRQLLNDMPINLKMEFSNVTYGDLCKVQESANSSKIQKKWSSLYGIYDTQFDSIVQVYADRRNNVKRELDNPSFSIGSRYAFLREKGRHAYSDDEIVAWSVPFDPFDEPSYISMFKRDEYIKKYVNDSYKSHYEYVLEQGGDAGKLIVVLDSMYYEYNNINHDIQVPLPTTDDIPIPEQYLK